MSRGSPSERDCDFVTTGPADIVRAVALIASRREEREVATGAAPARRRPRRQRTRPTHRTRRGRRPSSVRCRQRPGVRPGSVENMPPVTLMPVTAAASPVSATPVRSARRGPRAALCLPGARCVGTYFGEEGTEESHGGGERGRVRLERHHGIATQHGRDAGSRGCPWPDLGQQVTKRSRPPCMRSWRRANRNARIALEPLCHTGSVASLGSHEPRIPLPPLIPGPPHVQRWVAACTHPRAWGWARAGNPALQQVRDDRSEGDVLRHLGHEGGEALRSQRVSVMCANSGWPLSLSMTATMPSWRPTRRLSRSATSWVSTTLGGADAAEHREQHVALHAGPRRRSRSRRASVRPRMWVSGSTSSRPRSIDLVDDVRGGRAPSVSVTASPTAHLLVLRAGEEAELLAADREERTEHDHLLVLARAPSPPRGPATAPAPSCRCRRDHRATRCRPRGRAASRGRCAARPSDRGRRRRRGRPARGAPACRARCGRAPDRRSDAARGRCGRAGRGPVEVDDAVVVELVEVGAGDVELGHAGPAGVADARRGTPRRRDRRPRP